MRGERILLLQFEDGHVLNKDGIGTGLLEILKEAAQIVELVVVDDGVDRDIDLCAEGMGIVAELADIVDTIANRSTGTEARGTDIDGIGTVVDGRHTIFKILGGGK